MNDEQLRLFLQGLLSPVGSGIFLWAIVGQIIKLWPALNDRPEWKFWFTIVMAFVIPPAAFAAEISLGYEVFTWWGLLAAIGVSYTLSQTIHRATEKAVQVAVNQQLGVVAQNQAHADATVVPMLPVEEDMAGPVPVPIASAIQPQIEAIPVVQGGQ